MSNLYVDDGYWDSGYAQTGIEVIWGSKVIYVPRTSMLLIQSSPVEIRQLNLDDFRLALKDLEDNEDGMSYLDTHAHQPPTTVSGVTLARVVEIINDYTVTFEDGLYNVNITGGNSNIADKTNKNQVGVNTANSAGLQDLNTMLVASYDSRVVIDVINGQPGTTIPLGTLSTPVNNIPDAVAIAQANGLGEIFIVGDLTLDAGDNVAGYKLVGQSPVRTTLTINPAADTLNCEIERVTLTGTLDGNSTIRKSVIGAISYVNGTIYSSGLSNAVITLGGNAEALFINCYSTVPGASTPTIDLNGAGQGLGIRGYNGGLTLLNKTGNDPCSIDFVAGHLKLEASCTGGDVHARGIFQLTDNSAGTTIHTEGRAPGLDLITNAMRSTQYGKLEINPINNTLTIYDKDTGAVITVFDLFDENGVPSSSRVFRREVQ